jgi:hypothetical protein
LTLDPARLAPALISYLRDCHEADNRETAILDLLHENVQHRLFFQRREVLLNGLMDRMAMRPEAASSAQKAAALYKREKTLVYCAFCLVGVIPRERQRALRLCAPLLFYPARVIEETREGLSHSFLTVDLAQQRVNFPVLRSLLGDSESSFGFLEDLLSRVPQAPLDDQAVHELGGLLRDFLPRIDFEPLHLYPQLVGEEDLREFIETAGSGEEPRVRCLSACGWP